MKILITEQQLSHIVKNSKLNEQFNIKKALGLVSVNELNILESEDIKRGVKKILDLCEKFEHNGGVYYIFQQIPSLSPENIILKDDRREIALYIKQTPEKNNYRQNIIFYNKLIFDNLLSKYSTNYIEYAIKYNIINVLIDENVITKKSFNYSINYYYANNNKNQRAYPLSEWFNKYVESKTTDEILNATRLKSLSDLDLDSMKGDEFSDEGLSGFDKFKRNVSNTLTGLDEKESYFVSKLANIFDLAVEGEKYTSSLNIPDENGDDYMLLHVNPCTLFLKNAPIKDKESLITYLESLKTIDSSILRHFPKAIDKDIFTKIVKKAVDKSSNKKIKKYIGYCSPGYPIIFR
jgi:hypothetical protein